MWEYYAISFTNVVTIIEWNDKKGFGFAKGNGVKYFVHISVLGKPVRNPKVGDTILVYKFGKNEKGARIEKGCLEGVPLKTNQNLQGKSNFGKKKISYRQYKICACIFLAILTIFFFCFNKSFLDSSEKVSSVGFSYNHSTKQLISKDEVAQYICDNESLPSNYVNKAEGRRLYESKTGRSFNKWNFNPWITLGVMIGGDVFENKEQNLPVGIYWEADVDYFGENRGMKRLVYSKGCQIYYTNNHYKTFEKLNIKANP